MQADVQTKNFKESSGICFSREDKAVAGLRGARDWSKSKRGGAGTVLSKSKRREAARVWSKNNRGESSEIVQGRQPPIQTGNSKESSGICFSREDKAVAGLGPAAYWRYVRSPRSDTNAVCPPENKFRSLGSHERKQVELLGAGSSPITARAGIFGLERGDKRYELSNHLGNVLTVVSDRRAKASCSDTLVSGYWADVVSTNDYYPFGMGMVERGDDGKYRYGFNGMQRDDEWQGDGNAYDFGARMYDGRLGRWMSVDEKSENYQSVAPYTGFVNNPIIFMDPNGKDIRYRGFGFFDFTLRSVIKLISKTRFGQMFLGFFQGEHGEKFRNVTTGTYSKNTHLTFEKTRGEGAQLQIWANIERLGGWVNLEGEKEVDGVVYLMEDLIQDGDITHETEIEMKIFLDPVVKNKDRDGKPEKEYGRGIEYISSTIHEITIHGNPFLGLILDLREGRITAKEFVNLINSDEYKPSAQHADFVENSDIAGSSDWSVLRKQVLDEIKGSRKQGKLKDALFQNKKHWEENLNSEESTD